MKKLFLILVLLSTGISYSFSQDYSTAAGIRGGFFNGFTVKHFLNESAAAEGILSFRYRGIRITGLYEIHQEAFQEERLKFYYGGGAHVAFYNGYNSRWTGSRSNTAVIGIDGIVGLEYTLSEFPINLGLDWKPYFNLVGYTGFGGDGGALSIRYVF